MENSLSGVRYYDYDVLRAVLYDSFGWYMEHISLITETADKMNVSIDELFQQWRKRLEKEMEDMTAAKRGDRI